MRSADQPYHARRLAGVDQALGDGRARKPAELLDQLRDRLDQLAANHPSASADGIEPSAAERPQETDQDSQIAEGQEISGPPDDPAEVDVSWRSGELRSPQRIAPERSGGVPGGVLGPHGIDRAKEAPYRPWFASDEPGDPWFVG